MRATVSCRRYGTYFKCWAPNLSGAEEEKVQIVTCNLLLYYFPLEGRLGVLQYRAVLVSVWVLLPPAVQCRL